MAVRAHHCPNCGAPLPTDGRRRSVRCGYCQALLRLDDDVVRASDFLAALSATDDELVNAGTLPLVSHAGRRYRLLGRVGVGASCDVFAAQWCRRVTERVLIKVPRSRKDDDLLERERGVLAALANGGAPGAAELSRRVPQIVAFGPIVDGIADGTSGERPALSLRLLGGFAHTLDDVRDVYPEGPDPRHAVWLWRRLLEVLSFAHASGWAHGAILPEHVVLHARDHGVMLVGWSCAVQARGRDGEQVPALCEPRLSFYPRSVRSTGRCTIASDLVMAARAVAHAMGASPGASLPASMPGPLAALLGDYVSADDERVPIADAYTLARRIAELARQVYGPPAYANLAMPGWPTAPGADHGIR